MPVGTTDDSAMIRSVQSRGAMFAFNTIVDSWNAIGLIYQPNLVTGDVVNGVIVPASPEGKANDSLVFGNYITAVRLRKRYVLVSLAESVTYAQCRTGTI
jgi:hypothetical protein